MAEKSNAALLYEIIDTLTDEEFKELLDTLAISDKVDNKEISEYLPASLFNWTKIDVDDTIEIDGETWQILDEYGGNYITLMKSKSRKHLPYVVAEVKRTGPGKYSMTNDHYFNDVDSANDFANDQIRKKIAKEQEEEEVDERVKAIQERLEALRRKRKIQEKLDAAHKSKSKEDEIRARIQERLEVARRKKAIQERITKLRNSK